MDPDAVDARAEFERMQAILRQRKEQSLALSRATEVGPVASRRARIGPTGNRVRTRLFKSRLLPRVAAVFGLLLLLGLGWVALTRNGPGPSPVSARNVPAKPKPQPAGRAEAPPLAIVSLDVVPWAKVDSIVDLEDGKPVKHEELESPCTFRLPVGTYAMAVSHPEFGSRLVRVEVREGVTNEVKLSLLSTPQLEKEVQVGGR